MMAIGVCAAETDAEAQFLRSSQELAFARLRSGTPGKLPRPVQDITTQVAPTTLAQVRHALSCSATGAPDTVQSQLATILTRHQPDEVILTGMIHDPAARIRSFQIAAEVMHRL
jgi:alkanesulfonate monooxygenase SsuD/methylene tetrahydromethanopterin reductase-like flavin-dependent oxidoreductase (luciferase family)